MYFLA
jgi:cytoskeletal protein CcmA (bactofilin family)